MAAAAAYASLVSLMNVIHDLQSHPSPPISLDKQIVESITQHITFFDEFLHANNNNRPTPVADVDEEEAADPLEMRIAAAAYAAEDAIEYHIVETIQQQKQRSNYDCGSKITRLLSCFRAPKGPNNQTDSINRCRVIPLQTVIEEMDLIKKVAVEAKDFDAENKKKNKVLVVHDQQVAMTNVIPPASSIAPNETLVGSDDVLLEITEKLTGGQLYCQVIPIEGMGGIGKTFLATSIYARPVIKEYFDICAWATISQHYDTREILCELVSQATNMKKEQLSGKSEDELGVKLYQYLFKRRFLIVMDDMWSIEVWDKIQSYFPNNENGSRVLVTTRLSQLCSQLNNDDYRVRMSFLDESSSWGLFSKIVFGEKSCPPELEEIGEKIVDNCRGLPLSIAVVGGLLKKMDNTRASWESVRDNLSSVVNTENDKHCLRLLKLSYNHLPVYLKPCFLYMGVFEEDKEIYVSTLVTLWVSEGFLKPTNGEALETTARRFLQDLIDRNLILIGGLGCTGSIKYCKIHDLVRDMCLKEVEKEGFYHVIGGRKCNPPPPPPPQGMNTQRRVVILRDSTCSEKKVRDDLRYMPYGRSIISQNCGNRPPISNMGLLRTLHADNDYFGERYVVNFLTFQHVNMRHLAINRGGNIRSFEQVSLFWNLQTLIISDSYNEKHMLLVDFWKMPQLRHFDLYKPMLVVDFWKMPQLRHIDLRYNSLLLPDPPLISSVVVMENLHTLKGVVDLKVSEGVIKRIPNIKKLKVRYNKPKRRWDHHMIDQLFGEEEDEYCVGNIKDMCRLESLSLHIRVQAAYNKLTFPHSLKKLHINLEYYSLEWDGSVVLENIAGSLPRLEKLKLTWGCFGKGKWETAEGQFPCLKYLEMYRCGGLENWTAKEEGSSILPRLEHLILVCLFDLENIPCELGNIDTLKSIELIHCGEGAVKCAKEMVDEQLDLQGQLNFHVDVRIDEVQEHLMSLAGPNFVVRYS